ncbi:MAG: hypothetical protein WBR10_10870, partial [Candidatus Acidiferrum sp.]
HLWEVVEVLILKNLFAVICTKIVQNAEFFVSAAHKRLRLKDRSPENNNANQEISVPGYEANCYPLNTIREGQLFVKGKDGVAFDWARPGCAIRWDFGLFSC